MSEEEILRYILSCVSYKHMFDLSPQITESAKKKEDLLFSSAVYFLRELSKNKNVFVEDIKKQRRMTNKELSRWLREKPTRECKHCNGSNDNFVYCFHTYLERCANEEVDDLILIREYDGEWREPLVEVEE